MSVPYGQPPVSQPPAAPQPGSSSPPDGGLDLGKILVIVTGGLGLIIYFLSFTGDAGLYLRTGLVGVLLVGGALLAVGSLLPKAPATLLPAAVLVITGSLFLLIDVTNGPAFLAAGGDVFDTPGLAIVSLVLAFLESAGCVLALLATVGVVKLKPRPSPFPSPLWGSQQPMGYPGGPGGPTQGGYHGQPPIGPPSGGVPPQSPQLQSPQPHSSQPQPPQPYLPQTQQYSPSSYYGAQPGQYGQYGSQPGPYGGDRGEPGSYSGERREPAPYVGEPGEPAPYLGERGEPAPYQGERGEPAPYLDERGEPSPYPGGRGEPSPYGGKPGTPPGGFDSPDKSDKS